ncbi:hypothetical protein ElyMa_005685800 [Elysia marginata]|uniref:Uncharacterized protein n=1 Tax=Elysia marginata TaxID=1093978 RepID=A0AAV4FG08_9GAST|nr:hypothetical protein ElyMa_005685800 [Elysia marginata]
MRLLIFISIFIASYSFAASSAFNCDTFLSKPIEQQRAEFTQARDYFIQNFSHIKGLDNSAWQLARLIQQKRFDPEIDKGIYLAHLPGYLMNFSDKVDTDFLKQLHLAINDLEDIGKCFHFRKRTDKKKPPLMALKLYENINSLSEDDVNHIFFGYTTSAIKQGKPVKVARGTDSRECTQSSCIFKNIPIEKARNFIKTHTVIRLVHSPVELERMQANAPEHPHEKHLPAKSWLTGVKLYKTGEIFTSPEIYVNIGYYASERLIGKNVLQLPWVTKKGLNRGNTLLLDWPQGSDKAKVVIMESDVDIPYDIMLDAAFGIGKHFSDESSTSGSLLGSLQGIISGWFNSSGWGEDDYIGSAVIDRAAQIEEVATDEGSAILQFNHEAAARRYPIYGQVK